MKVIFLGTGTSQGVPVIGCQCEVCQSTDPKDNRLRSSVFIEKDGVHFVVDTGPDFRQQMLRHQITKLDAVLFTHGHKDHTAGFDDIRGFNFIQKKAMDVFVDDRVEEVLRRDFYYCFTEFKYPVTDKFDVRIYAKKDAYHQIEIAYGSDVPDESKIGLYQKDNFLTFHDVLIGTDHHIYKCNMINMTTVQIIYMD